MAQLAIKGHPTRGSEVIALLEMLGGKNIHNAWGIFGNRIYTIDKKTDEIIDVCETHSSNYNLFTIEEFFEKFPYKVGDKVTHNMGIMTQITNMYWDNECNVIRYDIESPVDNNYKLMGMLAEHLQPYKEQTSREEAMENFIVTPPASQDKGTLVEIDLTRELCVADKVRIILGDYEVKEENGETYLVKKRPQYPKTYEECCRTLGISGKIEVCGYRWELPMALLELIICRDAYWKIAGNWKPDYQNKEQKTFFFLFNNGNYIEKGRSEYPTNKILIFPTEEMRDAFYENFKKEIEQCKELL